MRFLCLHGMGTNSQVLEIQLAALRYQLGDHHTYEFVEGTIPSPIAPEIKSVFSPNDHYFNYFDPSDVSTCLKALNDLDAFIAIEGPFDGVLAFSQGAALATTYLVRQARREPSASTAGANSPFKCAVFFSGGVPCDPEALERGEIRPLDAATDGEVIRIPTANVWGRLDELPWAPKLNELCVASKRSSYVHEGGHEIPGSKMKDAVTESVNVIRRAVFMASHGWKQ